MAFRKFAAQFCYIHIYRPGTGRRVSFPELIHQSGTGKSLFRIGKQLIDQVKLPHCQRDFLIMEIGGMLLRIQCQAAHRQLFAGGNFRPSQQRLDPQK